MSGLLISSHRNQRGDDLLLDNSTAKETPLSPLVEVGLIAAVYAVGRAQQFVCDARSVMGTDNKKKR